MTLIARLYRRLFYCTRDKHQWRRPRKDEAADKTVVQIKKVVK